MKPKPLAELKNFTVPVFMTISFQSSIENFLPRKMRDKRFRSILIGEDRRRRSSRQKQSSTAKIDI